MSSVTVISNKKIRPEPQESYLSPNPKLLERFRDYCAQAEIANPPALRVLASDHVGMSFSRKDNSVTYTSGLSAKLAPEELLGLLSTAIPAFQPPGRRAFLRSSAGILAALATGAATHALGERECEPRHGVARVRQELSLLGIDAALAITSGLAVDMVAYGDRQMQLDQQAAKLFDNRHLITGALKKLLPDPAAEPKHLQVVTDTFTNPVLLSERIHALEPSRLSRQSFNAALHAHNASFAARHAAASKAHGADSRALR